MSDSTKSTRLVRKNAGKPASDTLDPQLFDGSSTDDGMADDPAPAETTAPATPPDPFDPAALRINPNTAAGAIGVKRKIVTLKVGKPDKMEFCRVHPAEAYRIDTAVIEDKVNRESYLVAPALWPELPDFITLVRLCVAVNRQQEHGLAAKLDKPVAFARNLLRRHRETFPVFWRWSQHHVDAAMLLGRLETVFGWPIHTFGGDNPRSLANFPMQANGAEMMRLACCMATEAGITVCCPVHDAILIEADDTDIDAVVLQTQDIMREAAGVVLGGFKLESDAKIIRHPDRYCDDDRGRVMWDRVFQLATDAERTSDNPCD